ncbi:glycosyl hydrolase family 18 protein [Moorella sulfitireducens]|uniref:glycosyl hydrolase family 18 protein n=1 Tax=Neomoorella sulfitireducens TaxID=2972948 RepID=UPI0021AC6CDB|nr:glycosyl hydrolase family 18 protein [Moorella sulfitireducens]
MKKYINLIFLSVLFFFTTSLPSAPARTVQPYQPVTLPVVPVEQAIPASPTYDSVSPSSPVEAPAPPANPATRRYHVLGYYAVDYQGDTASSRSLSTYAMYIDSIANFSLLTDAKGNLTESYAREGAELARAKGTTALALIHNYKEGSFNASVAHGLLTSEANRKRLIENTIKVLQKHGYHGVNVDLENIPPGDRPYYSSLIREFKEALQPLGYLTTVSIPAKTRDDPDNAWSGAFDYKAIGKYADWVQIMTYDEHHAGGPPGPIASLPWVEKVIRYSVTTIPPEKILLGIAAYGYDWSSATTRMVPAGSIAKLVAAYNATPQWNSTLGVPYLFYYKNGDRHEVWYEDTASLSMKLEMVRRYGLMGIGIWRLGYEDKTFWQAVEEKLTR